MNQSRTKRPVAGVLAASLFGVSYLPAAASTPAGVQITGQILIQKRSGQGPGTSAAGWNLAQGVVYLIPRDRTADYPVPPEEPVIFQKNATFEPSFLVVVK